MKPGDRVQLQGVSQHGKNRISELGNDFWVVEVRDRIQTTKHSALPGPFVMVINGDGATRWISVTGDPDFKIVE